MNHSNKINESIYLLNEHINRYNRTLNWLYGIDFLNESTKNVTSNINATFNQGFICFCYVLYVYGILYVFGFMIYLIIYFNFSHLFHIAETESIV